MAARPAFDNKNVGTAKLVTLTGAVLCAGDDKDNYTLASVGTTKADITAKPITVAADDKTKVYGSADPALTVHGARRRARDRRQPLAAACPAPPATTSVTTRSPRAPCTAGGNYDLTVTPGDAHDHQEADHGRR